MPTIDEKKTFLKQYLHCVNVENSIKDEIATLRASVMLPQSGSDGMPHGTNKSDLSGYAAKLDELIGKLQAELDNKWNARCAIKDAIEKLPDETEKAVLNFRYINGWKWEKIADGMGYTVRHVARIHGDALFHLEI